MPKKSSGENLGRSLLRKKHNNFNASTRHTTIDESDGGHQPISITENTSIDEFLTNAEAAQRSFEAERGTARIANLGVVTEDIEEDELSDEFDETEFCTIPAKPDWTESENPEEYHRLESLSFLKWKKQLNILQRKHPNLPPFEKNLDFWRQLWKIVEISDVVVQVVDARNPLFYHSHDLDEYVKNSSNGSKQNVMLLNKADYLSSEQRRRWADYFKESDMKTLFFSAVEVTEENKIIHVDTHKNDHICFNTENILTPHDVLSAIKELAPLNGQENDTTTIGFVGYPNVGKSSVINIFMENKRLQVSATPGKTKHYQTHVLAGGGITLVDGPGLVIPSLHMDKSEMVLQGILPIDNLTQSSVCVERLLETRIEFDAVVANYGIVKSCLSKGFKDSKGALGSTSYSREAQQLLSALGLMRGFMKPGGVPDETRAARVILKDFVTGKLLVCKAPPGNDQGEFNSLSSKTSKKEEIEIFKEVDDLSLEESFPELKMGGGAHVRGKKQRGPICIGSNNNVESSSKKHGNRKKREKIRRVYTDGYD